MAADHAAMIYYAALLPRLTLEHMQELEKIVNGTNIPADPLIREP
jgi:hypothetical protein